MSRIKILLNNQIGPADVRREQLDGSDHLVVPCVAAVEGVMNNIFYPKEVLENFVNTWNGVPVPVNHPKKNGYNVSANATEFENSINVGKFFNVNFANNSIKGEIWINIEKAVRLGFEWLINKLESGEMMEVSTGLFGLSKEESGEFNGKPYQNVMTDIRPDHLALLPNDVGACSIEDGCGAVRTNCKCKGNGEKKSFWNKFKTLIFGNEESHNEIRQLLREKVSGNSPNADFVFVVDVWDNEFVYELESQSTFSLYKQTYNADSNGNIEFIGEPIKVRMKTSYVPVGGENNNPTNNKAMTEKKKNALVDALAVSMIGNAESVTDEQKQKLSAMDEVMLTNMASTYGIEVNDEGKKVEPKVFDTPAPEANKQSSLSDDERAMLARFKANEEKRLADKRKKVVETNDNLTDAMVANMEEETLDALIGKVESNEQGIYGIGGSLPTQQNNERKKPAVFLTDEEKVGA